MRCWHAKTDGSAASTFHDNCDGKGPTVTIINYGSYIFGAYTDVSWHSSKYLSDSCFLSFRRRVSFQLCLFSAEVFRMFQTFLFILDPCEYSTASKAFIFSLYNNNGYNPVKLTQYRNQQNAMYGCFNSGPRFGHGIYISDNALSNQYSYTRCGYAYSVPSGYSTGDCRFFTGSSHFTPTDIEVFYEIVN